MNEEQELEKAFSENPIEAKAFDDLKKKRGKLVNFLMGQAMKANPNMKPSDVINTIKKKLDET